MEIEAIEGDEEKADSKAIKTSDLAVSNVSENVDKEDESISYTGQITNKSKKMNLIRMMILQKRRKKHQIVAAMEQQQV